MAKDKNTNISATMEENIKNYDKKIVTITEFAKAVRMSPSMYIGYIGNKGFINMIREILQNGLDQIEKNDSPADMVAVTYDEYDHKVTVTDNGLGIPFASIIRVFTSEHTSSNYNKKLFEYTSGRHGVGAKVTNALSSRFIVESFILGEARRCEFIDGKPVTDVEKIPNKENFQGTRITFWPSYEIMGTIDAKAEEVLGLLLLIIPLTKIGTRVIFNGKKLDGSVITQDLINTDGLVTHLINHTTTPLIPPISCFDDNGTTKAEIWITYDASSLDSNEKIMSFANFCPTIAGSHVNGFVSAWCSWFVKYMNNIYLSAKSKVTVNKSDILTGLVCCISSAHLMPNFVGQHKDEIDNADLGQFISVLITNTLDQWSKTNSQDLQKLCKYFQKIAEIRLKSEGEKVKLSNNYTTSKMTGKPQKYEPPSGKKNLELIIVEGDSAKGPAVRGRDSDKQGIFPIRGKLPNAFTTPKNKFLSNTEVSSIIHICGNGDLSNYGKNFNIEKCPFEKVICMADADADGYHIDSLLLRFFLLYMRPLIEHGRLYRAVPPLYSIKTGKNNTTYFTDKKEFILWRQGAFVKKYQVCDEKGKKYSNNELSNILINNIDYAVDLQVLSDTYSVHPYLLELVLSNLDKSINQLSKIVKSKYRFVDVEKSNGIIVCKGEIDYQYYTMFITEDFLRMASKVMAYIKHAKPSYIVNGVPMTLYGLMSLFDEELPNNLTRYKGLGEQNDDQLAISTLRPDGDRTLIRYTIEDAKREIEAIRYYDSNKYDLVKGAQVTRFDIG